MPSHKDDQAQSSANPGRALEGDTVDGYTAELEQAIQRNYYPELLSSSSRMLSQPSNNSDCSLTSFHASTPNPTGTWLQGQFDRETAARCRPNNLQLAPSNTTKTFTAECPYDNNDDDADFERKEPNTHSFHRPTVLAEQHPSRNTLFFPPTTIKAKSAAPTSSFDVSVADIQIDNNQQRSIEPSATRFPSKDPSRRRRREADWEGSSSSSDESDDTADDGSATDLDSTVVASIRAEIQQHRVRSRRKKQRAPSSTSWVAPSSFVSLSNNNNNTHLGYQLPPLSSRHEPPRSLSFSQPKPAGIRNQDTRGGIKRKRPVVDAAKAMPPPRKRSTVANADFQGVTRVLPPSARTSDAFAFALRSAYSATAASLGQQRRQQQKRQPQCLPNDEKSATIFPPL